MWEGSDIIINCINNCFKNIPKKSTLSDRMIKRENDPEQFIKRITPQIIECYKLGYKYNTPEDWDTSFNLLGGGQQRRTSSVILKRMSWEQFLYNVEIIIEEFIKNEQRN